jgi:hypothetical protein
MNVPVQAHARYERLREIARGLPLRLKAAAGA